MKLFPIPISRSTVVAAIFAVIIIASSADTFAIDGLQFRELSLSYRKVFINGQDANKDDLFKAGLFTGYVWAIVESWHTTENDKGLFSIPTGLTNEQAARIVFDYIEKHPEFWHLPGMFQTSAALQEKFPPPYLQKSELDGDQDK